MLQRALRLLRDVNLAFLQACDEILGREIDQLDGIGAVEDEVRHGLADADPRDLGDDVVEAVDVLDVDGRVDVDAVVQDLLDVEVALGMAAAGSVGVGKLVDQHDLRAAGEDGVEVHLLEALAPVLDLPARDDLEAFEQCLGLLPAMRLDHPGDDIVAVLQPGAGDWSASRRSCRRRARRRRRCAAYRRGFPRAGPPPARPRVKVACRDRVALQPSRGILQDVDKNASRPPILP